MESQSQKISSPNKTTGRRKKTSSKKGEISVEPKAKNYSYSLRKISISLQQIMSSGNSLRGVQKNWEIDKRENQEQKKVTEVKIPSYTVIRQWLAKVGLYELQRSKEKRDDGVWILDFTIELGTEKCLVILGI